MVCTLKPLARVYWVLPRFAQVAYTISDGSGRTLESLRASLSTSYASLRSHGITIQGSAVGWALSTVTVSIGLLVGSAHPTFKNKSWILTSMEGRSRPSMGFAAPAHPCAMAGMRPE